MRTAIWALNCAVLGGCGSLPSQPWEETPAVDETAIMRAVRCELKRADASNIGKYDFGIELDLKLVNGANAQASAVLVLPQAPETVSGSIGAGLSSRSTRRSYKTVEFPGDSLQKMERSAERLHCPDAGTATGLPSAIEGLGVAEWATRTFSTISEKSEAELKNAYYSLEFVLTANGSGGIAAVAYRVTGASVGAGLSREATHVLKVAATRRTAPPKPLKVQITGWPSSPSAIRDDRYILRDQSGLNTDNRRRGPERGERGVSQRSSEEIRGMFLRDKPTRLQLE